MPIDHSTRLPLTTWDRETLRAVAVAYRRVRRLGALALTRGRRCSTSRTSRWRERSLRASLVGLRWFSDGSQEASPADAFSPWFRRQKVPHPWRSSGFVPFHARLSSRTHHVVSQVTDDLSARPAPSMWRRPMTHVEQLREQVGVLRALAASFDNARIREQLLLIAAQCEEWATAREQALREGREPPVEM
jgi:hypothetical protein